MGDTNSTFCFAFCLLYFSSVPVVGWLARARGDSGGVNKNVATPLSSKLTVCSRSARKMGGENVLVIPG